MHSGSPEYSVQCSAAVQRRPVGYSRNQCRVTAVPCGAVVWLLVAAETDERIVRKQN